MFVDPVSYEETPAILRNRAAQRRHEAREAVQPEVRERLMQEARELELRANYLESQQR